MDLASGRRSKVLVGLAVIAGLYWLAMFVGTHIPIRTTPTGDPYSLDKLEHITAFGLLAALLCGIGAACRVTAWKLFVGVFGTIAVYGMLDETTQALVSQRNADVFDWLADVVGAAVGIAAFAIVRRLRVRSGSTSGR
ncbi:MAG TPA: VanZ family protein [Pirellulaceae bacterium]|nr:VanZ family protein [Pirellulaceae bacterium]